MILGHKLPGTFRKYLKVLSGFLVLALFAINPASASVTATNLGTGNGTTTAVITTINAAPSGSLIVVVVSVATTGVAVTSVIDSSANCTTYTAADNTAVASRPTVAEFYCPNVALASGHTITVTVASADKVAATAFALSGMATSSPLDVSGKLSNGASGTSATSVATGTLAAAPEVIVGALALVGTSSAYAPGLTFSSIGGVSSANGSAYAAVQYTCTTTGQASVPSWTTSNAYMSAVLSFKVAASDSECTSKLNAYALMSYASGSTLDMSKTNAYGVLQYATSSSKMNAYFILLGKAGASGLPFHVFP